MRLTSFQFSDHYAEFKERPGDDPDDVHFNTLYGVRTIQLNRPKKYNALNESMIRKIVPRLKVHKPPQVHIAKSLSILTGISKIRSCLHHNHWWRRS